MLVYLIFLYYILVFGLVDIAVDMIMSIVDALVDTRLSGVVVMIGTEMAVFPSSI